MVGNPVAPRLDPCPPRPSKLWVGSRRGQPHTGRTFNLRLGICQRSIQRPDRGVASKGLIVAAKGADLLQRLVGVADQRRATVPRRCPRRASIRSSAARSSSCTSEAGTIRPAARSASLRASAARSSVSLGIGGCRSAGCVWCGVSSMGERIGRRRPMFQCGASPTCSDLQTSATSATHCPRVVAGLKRGDVFAFYAGDSRVEGPHPLCSSGGNLGNGRTRTAMYTDCIEQFRGTRWRTAGQGSGRDCAGGVHHAE